MRECRLAERRDEEVPVRRASALHSVVPWRTGNFSSYRKVFATLKYESVFP